MDAFEPPESVDVGSGARLATALHRIAFGQLGCAGSMGICLLLLGGTFAQRLWVEPLYLGSGFGFWTLLRIGAFGVLAERIGRAALLAAQVSGDDVPGLERALRAQAMAWWSIVVVGSVFLMRAMLVRI